MLVLHLFCELRNNLSSLQLHRHMCHTAAHITHNLLKGSHHNNHHNKYKLADQHFCTVLGSLSSNRLCQHKSHSQDCKFGNQEHCCRSSLTHSHSLVDYRVAKRHQRLKLFIIYKFRLIKLHKLIIASKYYVLFLKLLQAKQLLEVPEHVAH